MAKEQLYELGMTKLHIMTQPGLVVIAQISKHTEILNVLDRSASFILIPGQVQCITFVILPSVTLLFTWGIFKVFRYQPFYSQIRWSGWGIDGLRASVKFNRPLTVAATSAGEMSATRATTGWKAKTDYS